MSSFYDHLAPHFRAYSEGRAAYLSRIDRLVEDSVRGSRWIDIGSGDGVRASRLARTCGIEELVLVEPNPEMARLSRRQRCEVLTLPAEELELPGRSFDNVTCLWNVLGHIQGNEFRLEALRNMSRLLAPDGLLHLDVHNRYNFRAYGALKVMRNLAADLLRPRTENGERTFEIRIGGESFSATGYLFNPRELSRMFRTTGLRVVKQRVIDYETGVIRKTVLGGHLYYQLARQA